MVGSLRGQNGPRPIPGLIHITPSGSKERCRCRVGKCPYGGPHGRSLTRQRKNSEGVYVEPPVTPPAYENLPLMTLGTGRHTQALELEAKARKVAFAGGNDEETVMRLFPPREPKRPINPNNGKPYPTSYDVTMAGKWDSLPVDEKLVEIDRLCHDRYTELGFGDLYIYYTNDFRTAGTCHYETVDGKVQASHFSMSIPLAMTGNYDSLFDTINHEAAHASNPGHSHDSTWSKAFVENGGNGQQYHSIKMRAEFYKVRGTCSKCGSQVYRKGFPRGTMLHLGCRGGTFSYEKNQAYVGNLDMNKALKKAGKEPNALRDSDLKKTTVLDLGDYWEICNKHFDVKGYLKMCYVFDETEQELFMDNVRRRWLRDVKPTHTPRYIKQRFKAAIEAEGNSHRWGI